MNYMLRIALASALALSGNGAAIAAECGDTATRLVQINQRILQLLPHRADLTRFVLDDSAVASERRGCTLKVFVALTTERNAQAHALADALRKEPQVESAEITLTRVDPPQVVHTDITLTLR